MNIRITFSDRFEEKPRLYPHKLSWGWGWRCESTSFGCEGPTIRLAWLAWAERMHQLYLFEKPLL